MARKTPKEATAVNVLLGYFAGKAELLPREVVLALENASKPGRTIGCKLSGMKWRCVASGRMPTTRTRAKETAEPLPACRGVLL